MIAGFPKRLESTDIFKDLFTTQIDRGYEPGKYRTYFTRYIGYNNEKNYNDNLAYLDKEISNQKDSVLLFTESIPVPFDQELTVSIMNELSSMDINNLANEEINLVPNQSVNERIKLALQETALLFIKKENYQNQNILNNFMTKIMIWCNHYVSNIDWSSDGNPKCIFYGEIKKHEAYFLILLSLIGMDVLYINSLEDSVLNDIDKDCHYSNVIINSSINPIENYYSRVSKGEVITVVETVAHQATKDIQEMFFNGETGIFKPWQFADGNTFPALLASTIDEIEIYWNEPAKFRPGFKVEGKTVYVPCFFAQINGVHKDRSEYFKFVSKLKSSKYTFFAEKPDILDQTWSSQDMYSLAFYLNAEGEIDTEEIKKHPMYKFNYLKEELQNFIINKTNELLKMPNLFTDGINDKRKLMIISTVLSIPEKLLQLIECFDYTGMIPKLVFYVNDRSEFGEEDICMLALFNRIGFDIVVLSPSNSNNVERSISKSYIVNHRLDEIEFNLKLNTFSMKDKGGFFKKFFI